MAKLPSFRRLQKTDFADEFKDLIDRIGQNLNVGIETLYNTLNKNVSLRDNIQCTVKDIDVELATDNSLKTAVQFSLDTTGSVIGLSIINVQNLKDSNVLPTAGVFASFVQSGNSLKITNIRGIPAGYKFRLTVVAYV
jgi:hypothetical protein